MSSNIHVSSTSFIETSLIDDFYPIRAQLSAKYKKNFGYKTIGYRLPVILTKIIDQLSRDKNNIGETISEEGRSEVKDVVGRIAKLKNEIQTNKMITPLGIPIWDSYIKEIGRINHNGIESDVSYFCSPWLFVECYVYNRIHLSFTSTKYLKSYDYFRKQKEEGFMDSINQCNVLGKYTLQIQPNNSHFTNLLQVSLWGNRCDLSLSGGDPNSQVINLLDHLHILYSNILCDNSDEVWKLLENQNEKQHSSKSIGYILDNAGFELFTDFCFCDLLLNYVDCVVFYVKEIPWFVSDTNILDFNWILDQMEKSNMKNLNELSKRWKGFLQNNRWKVIVNSFWTYPHTFNEMKSVDPSLYSNLSQHILLIFKGDLNYRKLVGDINWEPETPFKFVLRGFTPGPILAIRTCKADTIAGIKPEVANEISKKDPNWLITGEYGIIQFTK